MNPMFQQIINDQVRRYIKKKHPKPGSDLELERLVRLGRVAVEFFIRDGLLISLGILSAGLGLKGFLVPNDLVDGGVVGISLLAAKTTPLPLPFLLILLNAPFIWVAYRQIGQRFAVKSVVAICGLALATTFIPFPVVTSDKLLVAVFGGFFAGAGIGLAVRGGAVIDGSEVLAVWLNKRSGLGIGDFILLFNLVVFSVAALLLGMEVALYSTLTYLVASKAVNFIVEGFDEYMGVTIISGKNEEIRLMLTENMGKGVTIYEGKGGFGKQGENPNQYDILYTIITRLEWARLQKELESIDEDAFVVASNVYQVKGGFLKKRAGAH